MRIKNLLCSYSILLLLLFFGCTAKVDKNSCLDLYTKAYKGHPPSAHKYKKYCDDDNLRPKLNCEKALKQLISGKSEKGLKKIFGKDVMKCFTQNDLKAFLKHF